MLGLENKGHLSPGADADITVLNLEEGFATMGIASGNIIMINGIVIGNQGTIITTSEGKDNVAKRGVPYSIVDRSKFLQNKNFKK